MAHSAPRAPCSAHKNSVPAKTPKWRIQTIEAFAEECARGQQPAQHPRGSSAIAGTVPRWGFGMGEGGRGASVSGLALDDDKYRYMTPNLADGKWTSSSRELGASRIIKLMNVLRKYFLF